MRLNERALIVMGIIYSLIPLTFLAKEIGTWLNNEMPIWITISVGWLLLLPTIGVSILLIGMLITAIIKTMEWINELEEQ